MSYAVTKNRIVQWLGIILIVGLFAGAYWYFEVRAGYKTNVLSPTGSLTSGLIGYWPFDSVSVIGTTALDRSTNKYNGLISGGAVVTSGRVSQAVNFDGTDDSMALGSTGYLNVNATADMTISGWFSRDTFTTDDVIVSKINGIGPGEIGYGVYISSGDQLIFKIGDGVQTYTVTTSMTFTTSVWTHFSIVWDQDSAVNTKIYVDGQSVSTSTSGTISDIDDTSHTNTFRIGALSSGGELFDGKLDEIRVYNRTLTASEVLTLYNFDGTGVELNSGASQAQGGSRLDSGLAGYWKLDDGSGTSATDASTNSNTGTLTNGPTWTTGQIGGAVNFDGVDDYINVPYSSTLTATQGITYSFWIQPDLNNSQGVIGALNGEEGSAYNYINIDNAGTEAGNPVMSLARNIGGSTAGRAVQFAYPVSTWFHYTYTYDGAYERVYINGTKQGEWSQTGSFATNTERGLLIGTNRVVTGIFFDGALDEVRVYNRSLSSDEVAELYHLNTPSGTDTGLDGYWSFNGKDVSGTTAYDRSGSGNNGTLTNGPTITPGKVGQALNFDGTNDSVVLNTSTVLKPALFTVSTWAYADTGSISYRGIYLPSYADGYNSGFLLYINNDGHAAVRYGNGSAPVGNITSGESVLGGWHYLVTTFDGTTLALFVDGVRKSSTTASTLAYTGSSTTAQIGAGNGTDTFDGKLDEFRLYGRAFTEAEIVAQYSAGRSDEVNSGASQAQGGSRLDSGLAGYWKLDDGSGTSATDASTNGNTGTLTLTNGPTWTTGQIGGAVSFDGADDYIQKGSLGLFANTFTVSLWAKMSSSAGADYILDYRAGTSLVAFRSSSGYNDIYVRGTASDTPSGGQVSPGFLYDNTWHMYSITADGVNVRAFRDGIQQGVERAWAGTISTSDLTLGRDYSAEYFQGLLDEVRIYNRALSSEEVVQLYRLNTPSGTDTSLKGYWSFNGKDMSGTTAYDRSGAGNTGTLTNGPAITEGKLGQALFFDGSNDYVDAGTRVGPSSGYTNCLWAKPSSISGTKVLFSAYKDNIGDQKAYTQFFINGAGFQGRMFDTYSGGFRYIGRSVASGLEANVWSFLCMSWDGGTTAAAIKLYRNGAQVDTTNDTGGTFTAISTDSVHFWFGSQEYLLGPNSLMSGALDEARIYNRALSTAEIAALYNSSR